MYTIVIVLTVLVAILLIGVVLIQKSKGGGLASGFSGANQIMGVRHTNNFIEKTTWVLAATVAVLAVLSTFVMPRSAQSDGSHVKAPAAQQTPVEQAPAQEATTATDNQDAAPLVVEEPAEAPQAEEPTAN